MSGALMSVTSPHSKRDTSRSSRPISLGGRSEVSTICRWASCSALKVWKNSSWVRSFPSRNWMSSTRSRSICRYWRRNSAMDPSWMALTSSLVKRSELRYITRFPASRS